MGETAHATSTVPDITPFIWLLLAASIVAMIGQRIRIPYALALVITGLLIGAPHLLPNVHLEPHTLFTVFLPPLLFESALNLRLPQLRSNWLPIAVFAIAGTVLSTVVAGYLLHYGLGLPLAVCLVFGALISPTDPISVMALFKRLGVGRRLSLLVEGESLFNDGVAVVLFGVLLQVATGHPVSLLQGIQHFFVVVVGGAAVGLLTGLVTSRLTRHFDDHLLEITLTTIVAFGSYLGAEAIHVSGVIAVVVAGLVVGNYGMPTGMSPTTRLAVSSFWEYAAFAANSLVFLLVGIEVTFFNIWARLPAVGLAIGIVLVSRAAGIYPVSLVVNALRASVPLRWQHVFFWGGVRGALSMALVLGLGPTFPHRETLVVLTFGVVLFSLLVQGLTVEPLLKGLGLTEPRREAEHQRLTARLIGARGGASELERLAGTGAFPRAVYEALRVSYEGRARELEEKIDSLHVSNEELLARQTGEARRLALLAEKSALQEAWRNGRIDEEDLRCLEEELDSELAELTAALEGH